MKHSPINLAVGALLLLIFALLLFVFQVRTTETAVVTTFGRVSGQVDPGPHFRWPWPVQSVYKFDKRVHNFESKFEQIFTADGNSLLISIYVGWNINDATAFLTRFNGDNRKAEASLEGLIRNAYSGVVGQRTFKNFVSTDEKELKLGEIEQEMQTRIQTDCRALTNGLNIAFLGIKRLGLPENVTKLVFERMESEREVLVSQIKGEGERQASELKSRADYESAKLLAEADAQATKTIGEGEKIAARSFETFKQEPDLAIFLLKLKALEQFLQNRTTLILDDSISPMDMLKSQNSGGKK